MGLLGKISYQKSEDWLPGNGQHRIDKRLKYERARIMVRKEYVQSTTYLYGGVERTPIHKRTGYGAKVHSFGVQKKAPAANARSCALI